MPRAACILSAPGRLPSLIDYPVDVHLRVCYQLVMLKEQFEEDYKASKGLSRATHLLHVESSSILLNPPAKEKPVEGSHDSKLSRDV
ncbi:hypothetical protein M0802_006368 [Mischocyttarus mexicanus]|nr:hypothetical protein M0802_013888 [Mischocyttarus mexicanus]KAI4498433.1 hypothetical protein M0802_006368 [Mischocyttarus mexicanus]